MMRKKYFLYASVLIVLFMMMSISSASVRGSSSGIYERLSRDSLLKKLVNRVTQVRSSTDNSLSTETSNIIGDKTPYDGNHIDEGNTEDTPTIDQENGSTNNTIIENGKEGTNKPSIDPDGPVGRTILERVVNIVIEQNGNLGATLQRVIERIYAPGTTAGSDNAAAVIETTVVVGSSGTNTGNNQANVVVTTNAQ
ncbi:MAG: hypothetical protein V1726_08220 [Methanobacteriota archaeon]